MLALLWEAAKEHAGRLFVHVDDHGFGNVLRLSLVVPGAKTLPSVMNLTDVLAIVVFQLLLAYNRKNDVERRKGTFSSE